MAGEWRAPRSVPNPKVGPVALRARWRVSQPWFPGTALKPESNELHIMPTYRRCCVSVGPAILRRGKRTWLWRPQPMVWTFTGVTRDSSGVALGGCTVHFFKYGEPCAYLGSALSDGSGNYTFSTGDGGDGVTADAYLAGSPDVAGRSVNTLAVSGREP